MKPQNSEHNSIQNNSNWCNKTIDDLFEIFNSNKLGISEKNVDTLLLKYGKNEIIAEKKESVLKLFLDQFKSLLILILITAALVSALIDQPIEAIAIIIIVILAGILGFVQEYQAGKAIESLKKMAAPHATVIRDGVENIILSSELVPGDIITIKTGDKIPADARLIEANNLRTDEASLTGESLAIEKHASLINEEDISLGDRLNMLFMGTSVSYGRGRAIVVNTGMKTEFGKIAALLQSTENRKTPLQINLDQLGKKIGIYAIIIAGFMSVLGYWRGNPFIEMFIWGVALAVAIIPEALPAVVTISIALGVRRMVKKKALIRKLPAVETLGSTNIICSDKTGTLTQDEMTIREIFSLNNHYFVTGSGYNPDGEFSVNDTKIKTLEDEDLKLLLMMGSLCNDTTLRESSGKWEILGDPTEGAIIVAAAKAGLDVDKFQSTIKREFEIPFSSESKRMTTVNNFDKQGFYSISKGALEIILPSCKSYLKNGIIYDYTDQVDEEIIMHAEEMGKKALRVLAIAYKKLDSLVMNDSVQDNLVFAGIVGMIDPPRPEVKKAIKICEAAGIKPIMITGDHEITAVAVAKELGIMKNGGSISGSKLEKMNDEEFELAVDTTEVYARISPSHKLKIVNALMKRGNIVAMTGDGVNDAPSLKKADIGVAMGIKGTDVSREAADMILTDDNFASIVAAVEEGRGIFQNIRKYLIYLLGGNLGTVLAMITALLFALPIPLQAVQILFINFLMDGLIAIALGVEPAEEGLMKKQPRNVNEGILNKQAVWYITAVGFLIGAITIGIFTYSLKEGMGIRKAETVFFVTLILSRIFNGLNCRSLEQPTFQINLLSNKPLLFSIFTSLALTIVVIYVDFFAKAFHTEKLSIGEWAGALLASLLVLIVVELFKYTKLKIFRN
ncbi:MAG: cation-translocating P-type ATPase [bacterium]